MNCLKAKKIKKGSRIFYKKLGVYGILLKKIPFETSVKISLKSKSNAKDTIIVDINDIESAELIDSVMYGCEEISKLQQYINIHISLEEKKVLNEIIDYAHSYRFDIGRLSYTLKVSPEICLLKLTGYINFSEEDFEKLHDCFKVCFRQVIPAV